MTDAVSGDAALIELLAVAQEQLRWQQAASLPAVREALIGALTTSEMRTVYEMCDGDRTFREIATAARVALSTVSSWTRRWREAALVYETATGRMQRLVSLDAIGIPRDIVSDQPSSRAKKK